MFTTIEEFTKFNKESAEKLTATLNTFTQSYQAVATEIADYAKKSFEANTAAFEKLAAVKTIDKAIELQVETSKVAYEAAIAKGTKIGEIYQDLAKEAAKPLEAIVAKVAPKAAK